MQPNYRHLYHFWRAARTGSLSRAAEELGITHATMSVQIRALEDTLRHALFERHGKRLVLTALGEQVADYCDEIFRLGSEVIDVGRGATPNRRTSFRVGIVASLPKSVACELLRPVTNDESSGSLVVRQGPLKHLLGELGAARLHVVLCDVPPADASSNRVFVHELGESGILLYGTAALVRRLRARFPRSLHDSPLILPLAGTYLRRQIDRWMLERGIKMNVRAEVEDAGMMRALGLRGTGIFPVREALRAEVEEEVRVECLGALGGVSERYYAVSTERRVRHPAVSAIVERARLALEQGRKRRPVQLRTHER